MRPRQKAVALSVALAIALSPSAWAGARYKVLHSFGSGKDGYGPFGRPILDSKGNLYGVTGTGGTGQCSDYGCGTVFKLTPQANGSWKEAIVHDFTAGAGGAFPWGNLVIDGSRNLYGTMSGYGSFAVGGVFNLVPGSGGWSYGVLYSDGAGPGLLMDGAGNLYGDMGPGQYQGGAIGELSPGSGGWTYTQLYSFDGTDGVDPPAPPIWDGKGNMFGTTSAGGIYSKSCFYYTRGCGVIFEMSPNGDGTWTYHVLHRFASFKNDGNTPYSGLSMDKSGSFYGATWAGGRYGQGTAYKLSYADGKWKETILYDFPDCAYGCMVEGTLALDKSGNLYGTANGGTGDCGYSCGVVFKLSPQKDGKWKYSVVYDFTPEGGGYLPLYGVIVDDKGDLFGVTSGFGKYGGGTAFEITP